MQDVRVSQYRTGDQQDRQRSTSSEVPLALLAIALLSRINIHGVENAGQTFREDQQRVRGMMAPFARSSAESRAR